MIVKVEKSGNFLNFKSIIETMDNDNSIHGIMVYLCEQNKFDLTLLNRLLISCQTQLFGGVFPSVLSNGNQLDKGSIVFGFESKVHSQIIHNIHNDDIEEELLVLKREVDKGKTFFVNFDGLSEGVETLKEGLFYTLGLSQNYIGGGAGSISFKRTPCVITNEGLLKDVAVIAHASIASGVGVSHGWKEISEPLKVTEVNGNNIISLDWEPAFTVYQEQIKTIANTDINRTNFFEIAKAYPFGISKIGTEMVVRDPISSDKNQCITCVGAIPINSFVYLLNGDVHSLIEGAKQAKQFAEKAFINTHKKEVPKDRIVLLIDCISRALFLADNYQLELDIIGNRSVYGALALGEFANTGKAYLELYNKTTVVGILEESYE